MCKCAHSTDGEGMEGMCRPLAITIENLWLVLSYVRPSVVARLAGWLGWHSWLWGGWGGQSTGCAV